MNIRWNRPMSPEEYAEAKAAFDEWMRTPIPMGNGTPMQVINWKPLDLKPEGE